MIPSGFPASWLGDRDPDYPRRDRDILRQLVLIKRLQMEREIVRAQYLPIRLCAHHETA
jgi:hypothetical protein